MSTLNVSNITDGTTTVGTSYVVNGSAKAWVNFNGTGTIAARDSFNVASLTDNGTGDYTVNFTAAMSSANFSVCAAGNGDNDYTNLGNNRTVYPIVSASSSPLATFRASDNSRQDNIVVSAAFLGDLA